MHLGSVVGWSVWLPLATKLLTVRSIGSNWWHNRRARTFQCSPCTRCHAPCPSTATCSGMVGVARWLCAAKKKVVIAVIGHGLIAYRSLLNLSVWTSSGLSSRKFHRFKLSPEQMVINWPCNGVSWVNMAHWLCVCVPIITPTTIIISAFESILFQFIIHRSFKC